MYIPSSVDPQLVAEPCRDSAVILENLLNPDTPALAEEFRQDATVGDPVSTAKAEMMARLILHLEQNVAGPRVFAMKSNEELRLMFSKTKDSATHVTICIDANDYAPWKNQLPPFHYRVNYTVPNHKRSNALSVDRRSAKVEDVAGFVLEAIERCS